MTNTTSKYYDNEWQCWTMSYTDILRMIARGWNVCEGVREQMKSIYQEWAYGVEISKEHNMLTLVR